MLRSYQKGEISLTLSLLGILVTVVGVAIGVSTAKNIQSTSSSAQSYEYRSVLEIRDESNNVVDWEAGMRWQNGYSVNNSGDIKDPQQSKARLTWQPATIPPHVKLQPYASVTISLPSGYTVIRSFCDSVPASICNDSKLSQDGLTRSQIKIQPGGNVVYGLIVRKQGGPGTTTRPTDPVTSCEVQSEGCNPRNVKVDELSEKSVTITWEYPSGCPAYIRNTDPFWIDVIRDGTQIVCATESKDNEATCSLGKAAPSGRILDTGAEEYRKKRWDENRVYAVNVYLRDVSGSCVSSPGGTGFTYTPDKPDEPDPTNPPDPSLKCKAVGQSCIDDYEEACTTSTGQAGKKTCHKVGTCTGIGDGTQCSWGAGSSCTKCVGGPVIPSPSNRPSPSVSPVPPSPQPSPQPSPTPTGDLRVKVNNRIENLNTIIIKLEPCPAVGDCEKQVQFNGQHNISKTVVFNAIHSNTRHAVTVRSIQKKSSFVDKARGIVEAQENGIAKVDRCPGYIEPDGGEDEKCVVSNVPAEIELSVHPAGGTPPPPPSPVPPDPNPGGRRVDAFGTCDVFEAGHPCSPENLSKYFVGEPWDKLEKLSAICDRESGGNPNAKNLSCPTGGRDYSVGLFQINLMNPTHLGNACVDVHSANSCSERSDSQSCREQFFVPENNIREAVGKYAGSRKHWGNPFCPWKAAPEIDRCKLANYGNTYEGCWR